MTDDLDERLAIARSRELTARGGEPDVATLTDGAVTHWLAAIDEAIGRLLVSGLAHPDGELAPTLAGLADRAAALGSRTALQSLGVLAALVDALRPGPVDREERTALCARLWDELLGFQRWLVAFRREIGLLQAQAVSEGGEVRPEAADVPRLTARLFLDGLTFRGDTLVIHAHDPDGGPVTLLDPLVGLDADDPFDVPVVSRLFQEELSLRRFERTALDVDAHPFTVRGPARVLRPDLRARPAPVAAVPTGHARHVRTLELIPGDEVRAVGGESVEVSPLLATNLLKRRLSRDDGPVPVQVVAHRGTHHVLGARDDDRLVFPHVDPACWRASVASLPLERASAWLKRALAGIDGADVGSTGEAVGWRQAWWASRRGLDVVVHEPGEGPPAVWAALYRDDPVDALQESYRVLPDPSLSEAAARAMLLHRSDAEAAVAYLDAHLHALRGATDRGEPLPPSAELLYVADALAWIHGADRAGPVADALDLPAALLRRRLVLQLTAWVDDDEPRGLGDTVALASASSWGSAVLVS